MYNEMEELKDIISTLGSNTENIDSEVAHLRDTFLTAERDYVRELLKNEKIRDLITDTNSYSSSMLFGIAQELVDNVENGLVKDEEMENIEKKLIVILAAIQDKVLVKDLVLVPEENSYGKHR